MTIGIYALYWENEDLVYIGQSQNILVRFKEHISKLGRHTHSNYKVQDTYNTFGKPSLVVLQICKVEELNYLEEFWTKEFDSLHGDCGLNIIEAGEVGYGVHSNSSKYSKMQILTCFKLLSSSRYIGHVEISNITKLPIHVVSGINSGKCHLWLKDKYPHKYGKLISSRSIKRCTAQSRSKGKCLAILVSPTGEEFEVSNMTQFAIAHGLVRQQINNLVAGTRKQHKGWRLKR